MYKALFVFLICLWMINSLGFHGFLICVVLVVIAIFILAEIGEILDERKKEKEQKAIAKEKAKYKFDRTNNDYLTELFELKNVKHYYVIEKYIGFDEEEIIIPSTYHGYPIMEIEDAIFAECRSLRKIYIDAPITEIPAQLFRGCSNLRVVYLPRTLKSIETKAFYHCTTLIEVNLPDNIEHIGNSAFAGTSLIKIHIPRNLSCIQRETFRSTNIESVEVPPNVIAIEENAFEDCWGLNTVVLNNGLKRIESYAFCNCRNLKEISIPETVNYLGDKIFTSREIWQPDKRYNPRTYFEPLNIVIKCYPGSIAQEKYRKDYRVQRAE